MQFTIRGLMIAILAVAGLLGLMRRPDLLPLAFVVGSPVTGLASLLARVPRDRPAWRVWIYATILGLMILGAGWLWARESIWYLQGLVSFNVVRGLTGGEDYRFRGFTIPSTVTAICLMVYGLILVVACVRRPHRGLLRVVVGYAAVLAAAWLVLFGELAAEIFD
jgi:hypothetical protein